MPALHAIATHVSEAHSASELALSENQYAQQPLYVMRSHSDQAQALLCQFLRATCGQAQRNRISLAKLLFDMRMAALVAKCVFAHGPIIQHVLGEEVVALCAQRLLVAQFIEIQRHGLPDIAAGSAWYGHFAIRAHAAPFLVVTAPSAFVTFCPFHAVEPWVSRALARPAVSSVRIGAGAIAAVTDRLIPPASSAVPTTRPSVGAGASLARS